MAISSFETIAKHFAGQLKVKLNFKPKACPSTDGASTITLPTDMGDNLTLPTIGALLHESYHIKHTGRLQPAYDYFYSMNKKWFNGGCFYMKKHYAFVTNCLEDIRIDTMILNKYENARYIYSTLIDFGMEIHTQAADEKAKSKDPIGVAFQELVQQIYIYGLKFDDKYFFNKQLFDDFLLHNKKELDEILDNVKIRAQVFDLYHDIDKLVIILKNYLKIKDNKPKPEDGGEGEGKISEKELKKKIKKEYKEQKKSEIEEKEDDIEEIENDIEEIKEDIKDLEKEIKDTKDDNDGETVDTDNIKKEKEKKEKKQTKLKNDIEDLKKDIKEDEKSLEKIEDNDKDVDDLIDDILDEEFRGDDVTEKLLNGFKSIEKIKLELKSTPVQLENFEAALKEIFKRTERKKLNTPHATPYLNIKNLHKLYKHEGDITDIFSETKQIDTFNNKIIFLVDSSSSMGDCYMGYDKDFFFSKKNSLVFDCLENIRRIIEENQETYNIEYAVASFASTYQFGIIKGFDDKIIDTNDFKRKYALNFFNGNTNLIAALENCYKLFDETCSLKDKRFIICLTDGQILPDEIKTILEEYNARAEKTVFIGINKKDTLEFKSTACKNFLEKILMGRVVTTVKEMEATLIESFDRIL